MSERMVQVPVSLIEELRDAVGTAGGRAVAVQPALYAARAVAALLSQPTPTAEPFRPAPDGWFTFGSHVGFDGPLQFSEERDEAGDPLWERHPEKPPEPMTDRPHAPSCDGWMEDEGDCTCRPAEPPRIEDLAPGTTFWKGGDVWTVERNSTVRDEYGQVWPLSRIDPSTIRDVTPPA